MPDHGPTNQPESLKVKFRVHKTAFSIKTFDEASDTVAYWRSKTDLERMQANQFMLVQAYGFDPDNPPRMEGHIFSSRKQPV
jgi:hypothetical protein